MELYSLIDPVTRHGEPGALPDGNASRQIAKEAGHSYNAIGSVQDNAAGYLIRQLLLGEDAIHKANYRNTVSDLERGVADYNPLRTQGRSQPPASASDTQRIAYHFMGTYSQN
jgi:hypothetical protein